MASFTLFAIFFFSAIVFFVLFGLTWIIFGKLIMLQFKRWILGSRGYVEVEHVSDTKVRNYFILRPSKDKFDISDGFYHYIPECISRKGDILHKYNPDFLSKVPEYEQSELEGKSDKEQEEYKKRILAEWTEMRNIFKVVSNLNYDPQLLNRKFGMPVITYYGSNPDPINFSERTKSYGSGVIKDMYLRLLLTQRYNDFKMIIVVLLVSWVVVAIALFGLWQVIKTDASNLGTCLTALNTSQNTFIDFTNRTLQASIQGSTVLVH